MYDSVRSGYSKLEHLDNRQDEAFHQRTSNSSLGEQKETMSKAENNRIPTEYHEQYANPSLRKPGGAGRFP